MAMATRIYNAKSDIYSFGVFLFEVFSSGGTPYAELQTAEVLHRVRQGYRLASPSASTPSTILKLIQHCTQMNLGQRPTMTVVAAALAQICHGIFSQERTEGDGPDLGSFEGTSKLWYVRLSSP